MTKQQTRKRSLPKQHPPKDQTPEPAIPKQPQPGQRTLERQETRPLTTRGNLDNLKKEAKRWLKALRANDEQAWARLKRAFSNAPAQPRLRDMQHALALEHGLAGWPALKKRIEEQALEEHLEDPGVSSQIEADRALDNTKREEPVDLFLEYACADPILNNGPAAHARRARTALRILNRYPELARANIHTAVVCGDLDEVERILEQRPQTAMEPGGPQRRRHLSRHEKLWTPLLHLCYGRLPLPAAGDNAEAIARALLDHGADPNDYFEVGSHPCRYTALCGVAGEGEDDAPPHPQREALAQLLFERGAEPYDIQVIYNIHFHGNVLWFLELMYEFSTKVGRQADWSDPEWSMIGMGGFGSGARWHLDIAVKKNDLKLAEWVLAHGASPNAGAAPDSRLSQRPIYEEALRNGFTEMALMLKRYGATPSARVVLEGVEAFTAACFRLDREDALAQIAAHPEYLLSPAPMFAAARRDRADVVEFLIDLGMSIEVEDEHKQRPLHEAASHDSLRVAQLLIERGAEKEPVETNWNNTPLDHALYGNLSRMADFLSSFSRDVYRLTWIGNIDRLREVQTEEPDLAKAAADNNTPLMWIPEDEARAIEIVHMLVAGGADPKIRNKEGLTAADCAERRGLYEVADLLRSMERAQTMKPSDDPVWRDAVRGLERGDFSRLEPLFDKHPAFEGDKCRIVDWYEKGYFDHEPSTLAEALTCASFLGRTSIVDLLLTQGVDSAAGTGTGMSALHWAANRGNLDAVRLFIERKAPLELLNMYGGTVLSCTVWSAIHEARADHVAIIEALIDAGANIDASGYPTGNERVDEVLRRRGAK